MLARGRAYSVHVYTASGVAFAFLAAAQLMRANPDPRFVLGWLAAAVVVDATDGPLARRWQVGVHAPSIRGRTIDDIVDYLTFTFLPLMLVWRLEWLPPGGSVFVVLAMIASLFGFANVSAKFDDEGFFLGFPSYWNVYAFYAGLLAVGTSRTVALVLLIVLTVLTVVPVRFVYPNRIGRPWRGVILGGAVLWGLLLVAMLPSFPQVPPAMFWASLAYPAVYVVVSAMLDLRARRRPGEGA